MPRRRHLSTLALALSAWTAGCPKPSTAVDTTASTWAGAGSIQCLVPPSLEGLGDGNRRVFAREALWTTLYEGLSGNVPGAPVMDEDTLMSLELIMLGYPERIETFAKALHERCTAAVESGDKAGLDTWLTESPGLFSEGDCNRALIYEVHDELKINLGWQLQFHACRGDRVRIEIDSGAQLYTVYDTGTYEKNVYHGVLGDLNNPPTPSAPCQECRAGEILVRYTTDDGEATVSQLLPFGADVDPQSIYDEQAAADSPFMVEFEAPHHGTIAFSLNDDTYYDNLLYEDMKSGTKAYVPLHIYPLLGPRTLE
jgi:hypothetical protein